MGNLLFLKFGSDGGFFFYYYFRFKRGFGVCFQKNKIKGGFWGLEWRFFFGVCNVRINGLNMGLFCEGGGGT